MELLLIVSQHSVELIEVNAAVHFSPVLFPTNRDVLLERRGTAARFYSQMKSNCKGGFYLRGFGTACQAGLVTGKKNHKMRLSAE